RRLPRRAARRCDARQPHPRRSVDHGMKLGLFTPVLGGLPVKEMLAKVCALGAIQAIELGTGCWPGHDHIDPDALLANSSKAREYRQMVADAGLTISALSCHGNPLHPDAGKAKAD